MSRFSSLARIASQAATSYRVQNLYRINVSSQARSRGTGWASQDDYQVDYTDEAKNFVINAVRNEPANEGQESLLSDAIDNMEIQVTFWDEIPGIPEHAEGDAYLADSSTIYMVMETDHPEAIGLIIEKAYDAFDEFVTMLQAETEHI